MPNPYPINSPEYVNWKNTHEGTGQQVDSKYWQDLANTVKGTDYEQMFNNNPWRNYNYKETGWQKFLNLLGFRSGADKMREEMTLASNKYDSDLLAKMQQDEYNSSVAQAERMRQAGQNPDLLGTSGVSDAAPMAEQSVPEIPEDFASNPASFASGVLSLVMSGIGFAKDFQTFQNLKQTVDGQNIRNAQGLYDLALSTALNATQGLPNGGFYDNETGEPTGDSSPVDWLKERGFQVANTLPKRLRKRFQNQYSDVIQGIPFEKEKFKSWRESMEAYHATLRGVGSKYYSGNWQDDLYLVTNELSQFADKLEKYSLTNKAEYEESYNPELAAETTNLGNQLQHDYAQSELSHDVPEASAEAKKATFKNTAQQDTISRQINSTIANIVDKLSRKAEQGDIIAQGILLFFSVARMASMSASSTSGPKGVSKSFGFSF